METKSISKEERWHKEECSGSYVGLVDKELKWVCKKHEFNYDLHIKTLDR